MKLIIGLFLLISLTQAAYSTENAALVDCLLVYKNKPINRLLLDENTVVSGIRVFNNEEIKVGEYNFYAETKIHGDGMVKLFIHKLRKEREEVLPEEGETAPFMYSLVSSKTKTVTLEKGFVAVLVDEESDIAFICQDGL